MNAKTPKVIIHAGHGKTGSSALQSSLALSQETLLSRGIAYPDHPSFVDARAGNISSGNIEPPNIVAAYEAACETYAEADIHTILFSNEHFFTALVDIPDLLDPLLEKGVQIDTFLFVRNPLEDAVSCHVQLVKRNGSTQEMEEYLPEYKRPADVLRFHENALRLGLGIKMLNYSNHKRDVKSAFAGAIGLDPADLSEPAHPKVNRSLTLSELRLQMAFNAAWGQMSCRFVSDPLCNQLPDIKAEKPLISRAAYDGFVAAQQPALDQVNALLPEGEHYKVELYEEAYGDVDPAEAAKIEFSPEQIEVLARAISARIPQPEDIEVPEPEPEPEVRRQRSFGQLVRRVFARS